MKQMAITYTWKITSLKTREVAGTQGVVVGTYAEHVNQKIQEQIDFKKNPIVGAHGIAAPVTPPTAT